MITTIGKAMSTSRLVFSFALFWCLAIPSLCQENYEYRPFVEEGKRWRMSFYNGNAGMHRIYGDTVISGRKCKIWHQQERKLQISGVSTFEFTDDYRSVYVFEEDKKVWFFLDGETTPRLFFDFGAQIGDTLEISLPSAHFWALNDEMSDYWGYNYYERWWTGRMIIDNIYEMTLCNKKRRRFFYAFQSTGFRETFPDKFGGGGIMTTITEGIGGFAYPHCNMNLDFGSAYCAEMDYCIVGNDTLYTDGHQYPDEDGISMIMPENHKSSNRMLFDLTGRCLAAPPTRGLYIEDGKVKAK